MHSTDDQAAPADSAAVAAAQAAAGAPVPEPQPFRPPAGLRHPHLQSTLSSSSLRKRLLARRAADLLAASREVVLDCGDGVRLGAHVSLHEPDQPRSGRPLVVAIHGWNGHHGSSYLLGACTALYARGCDIVRLNLRDHGGTAHLNREMFHSCRLDEAVGAVADVMATHGERPYGLIGWSLGGNFALRIANAAPGRGLDLQRVAAVCPLLDPAETMHELDAGWVGYRLYFLRKWRHALAEKDAAFPGHFDFGPAQGLKSITAMTEQFVAAYTEYPDTPSYLAGYAITGQALAGLQIPGTILAALDDPVCAAPALTRLANPASLALHTTRYGGHCGFLQDWRLTSWADGWVEGQFADLLRS